MNDRRDTGPCFYCRDLAHSGGRTSLEGEEARHAGASRRIRPGERVGLIDGRGSRALAVVESAARERIVLTVEALESVPPPPVRLHLAVAIPKGERFRNLVDMLAQLGAAVVSPMICERGTVKPKASAVERWRRVALEACKQSRNPRLPVIDEPRGLVEVVDSGPADAAMVYADAGGDPFTPARAGRPDLRVFVGPEGGFAPDEIELLRVRGAAPVSLGANVLRVETAAVAAASLALLGSGTDS